MSGSSCCNDVIADPAAAADMCFGTGGASNSGPVYYPNPAPVPGAPTPWRIVQWHKAQYLDSSQMQTSGITAQAPLFGQPLYSWQTADDLTSLQVYAAPDGSNIFHLQSENGEQTSAGGAYLFLAADFAPGLNFGETLSYSLQADISVAAVSCNTALARSTRSVLAMAFTGFILGYNTPGSANYDASKPTINGFMQIGLTDSGCATTATYAGGSIDSNGTATLISTTTLPGDTTLPFAASSSGLVTLNYNLNAYLRDFLSHGYVLANASGGLSGLDFDSDEENPANWSLLSMYIGDETQNTALNSTSPLGSASIGIDVGHVSVTALPSVAQQVASGQAVLLGADDAMLTFGFSDPGALAAVAAALAPINAAVHAGSLNAVDLASGEAVAGAGELITHTGGQVALPSACQVFATAAASQVTVFGGTGNGTLVLSETGGIAFNAGAGAASVFAVGGNNLISAYAGAGNLYVSTGAGNDTVLALAGNDTIALGSGTNEILTGVGDDQIFSTGDDLIAASGAGNATITAGANNPTVYLGAGNTVFNGGTGQATVVAANGASTINALGGTQIWLGAKADVVNTCGADTIIGRSGAATVSASGNSLLFAGSGAMNFIDTAGMQTILGAAGGVMSIAGGAGSVVALSYGNTQFIGGSGAATIAGLGGSMTVTGGSGTGLFLGGTAGANSITGGAGQSTILGNGQGDVLTAGTGAGDVIKAGSGAETVNAAGSTGAERLYGGSGPNVIMTGGGSANVIVGSGVTTLIAGGGMDLYALTNGDANSVVIQNFSARVDYLSLIGFAAGAVSAALAGAMSMSGSEMLTLSDGTHVTLQGFSGLAATNFL